MRKLKIKDGEIRGKGKTSELTIISTSGVQIEQSAGVDGERTIRRKRKRGREFQRREMLSGPIIFGRGWAERFKLISEVIDERMDIGNFLR